MPEQLSTPAPAATLVARPAGLDYAPAEAKSYDWRTDIPTDALDAKDFGSIDAWLDACVAQGRPGKIGSGVYSVDGEPRYAPEGIYGYGDTPPTFVAQHVDAWLYLKSSDVALKGLQFEGFGNVLAGAVKLSPDSPYHSTTTYAFERFQPDGQGGSGLALQRPATETTVGPAVEIVDCVFINVENAFTFVSDTTQMGRIDFDGNVLIGSYGILDINSALWTEIYASDNEWRDATGARVQPNVKGAGVQTGFRIGTDNYLDLPGHHTRLEIVNNYAHDIQSVGTYADTNAAVFVDVRGAYAEDPADNSISFNKIVRLQGLKGQEDSNAIYAKAWGLTVQGNYIEASGAAYVDAVHNGSEATGVLVKPLHDNLAKDVQVVGNTFVNMPAIPAGVSPDLAVIKISEAIGDSAVSFNTFIGGGNRSGEDANGVVRIYGDYEDARVVGNRFQDVALGTGDNAIVFHELETHGPGTIEVSNNVALKTDGDFQPGVQMVAFDGDRPATLITGYNTVDGGKPMGLSLSGNVSASVQTYVAPMVSTSSAGALTVSRVQPLAENTRVETRIADVSWSSAGGAQIAVDDPRFEVKGDGLVLKPGQTINFEAQSSISLKLTLTSAGVTTGQAVTVAVRDVDDAPTAVRVGPLAALPENTLLRTVLGSVTANDADSNPAFRNNVFSVSDARFEIVDGKLALKAGQVVDFEAAPRIPLVLTATGSTGSASIAVEVVVTNDADGAAPAPAPADDHTWPVSAAFTLTLRGSGGEDSLVGTSAAELIDGQDRADTMAGGGGDDTYVVSSYRDVIVEGVGAGVDTAVLAGGRYALPTNVENMVVDSDEGSVLIGNPGSNRLIGGGGGDTLLGAQGDDFLQGGGGGDLFIIAPGEGYDVVADFTPADEISIAGAQFSSFADLKAHFQQTGADAVVGLAGGGRLVLKDVQVASLTAAQFSFPTAGASVAETARPTAIHGGTAGGDVLIGGDAADYLDGKGGTDLMAGGAGDDTYFVDAAGDRIVEAAGGGVDEVRLWAPSYALDPQVENVTVGRHDGAAVQGNAGANRMVGGDGDDTLTGGAGRDWLAGGDGADVFVYARTTDVGDVIADFTPGVDRLDLRALVSETGGKVAVSAVAGGLGVYLNSEGTTALVVVLQGAPTLFGGDLLF